MEMLLWEKTAQAKPAFLAGYAAVRKLPDLSKVPFLRFCKAMGALGFTFKRQPWQKVYEAIYAKNLDYLKGFLE